MGVWHGGEMGSSLCIWFWIVATANAISRVKLPGFGQTTITVPVPGGSWRNVPISLTTKISLAGPAVKPDLNNLVEFSVAHLGHLTQWSVLLQSSQPNAALNKSLCNQNNSTDSNPFIGDFLYVVAYSRTHNELQLEVGSEWSGMFQVSLNQPLQIDVNPNTTQTFQFSPSQYTTEEEDSSVLVEITSLTSTCMYVGINQPGCPWHHTLSTIHNSLLWARLIHRGFFTAERKQFPEGFTLSFISLTNNSECLSEHSPTTLTSSTKRITLRIKKQTTSYTRPVITAILSLLATGVLFSLLWLSSWWFYRRTYLEEGETDGYEMTGQESLEPQRSEEEVEDFNDRNVLTASLYEVLSRLDGCAASDREVGGKMSSVRAATRRLRKLRDDDLSLADLSVDIRGCVWHRRLRSRLYLLLVPLLSIFYLIPSFQLVYAELTTAQQLGNIDRCYYNFGCARPFWIFPDFNHTVSNCGFIIYVIFFIAVVYYKSCTLPSEQNRPTVDHRSSVGLVQQYSLFYTLGICMILQGIFSLIFHICPSNTSLQFDTTMMYMIMVLVFIKTYQFRHPDTTVDAFTAMYSFSFLIFLEAVSLYITKSFHKTIFYAVCGVAYLLFIIHLSIDNYYYGAIKVSYKASLPVLCQNLGAKTRHPVRLSLMILFFIFNLILIILIFVK